jgi:hypothetical protein
MDWQKSYSPTWEKATMRSSVKLSGSEESPIICHAVSRKTMLE